jgi:hypothetical protein
MGAGPNRLSLVQIRFRELTYKNSQKMGGRVGLNGSK